MSVELDERRRLVLRALCDTFVPSIEVSDDPTGFWARCSSDLGIDRVLAKALVEDVSEELRRGLLGLLDVFDNHGFASQPEQVRENILKQISQSSPDAAKGVSFFEKQTLLLTYGLPEQFVDDPNLLTYGSPKGQNPNWEILGYPGPISVPHREPDVRMQTLKPTNDQLALDADVCVIGSGAGGAVISAKLAAQGYRVIVLESGGQYTASDFNQLEIWGYRHLWYKGGAVPTADGNVVILAGGTLGGGTEVNWMNCVRTPAFVRDEWVQQHGLEGVDKPEFDRYLDTVERRLSTNSQTSYFNSQNLRLREGCQRLGYLSKQTRINWNPKLFQPLMAGYSSFGDQTGAKQTARRTYLLEAYQKGARIVVHCRANRILVSQGRVTGVEASYSDPTGRKAAVTVRAPRVVVSCGALESPALLLRSGIGGPAVGNYLRLHPGGAVSGIYQERQKGWWGSPQSANCEQFTNTGDGFGFYLETPAFGPGFVASVIPWTSGRQHKEVITKVPYTSTFIWFIRDKGHGQVGVAPNGTSLPTYQLADPVDQENFRRATTEAIRIHEAAGAQQILFSLAHEQIVWTRGQSLDNYIDAVNSQPLLNGAQPIISAHQLGSCRMGTDPATSVADTNGELHDVEGVWIGDGSACPTALGSNPMLTIMALAERTADRMIASGPRIEARPKKAPNAFTEPAVASQHNISSLPRLAGQLLQGMIGVMMIPFNMLAFGGELLSALPAGGVRMPADVMPAQKAKPRNEIAPMYSQIIELTTQPGHAQELIETIRDRAIPQIIQPAEGFVDTIVLLSQADPNHVTSISFWRSKDDADRFFASGFPRVSALLQASLGAKPERREFTVGASTNRQIVGWPQRGLS